jgi:hypothetical protein
LLVIGSDPMPPDSTRWGETPVSVGDGPVSGVTVNLRPGVTLGGRIEFDGSAPEPRPQQMQTVLSVAVEPAWPLALGARFGTRVAADGGFITQGVPPGKHFLNLPNQFSTPGWFFESATLDGKDLMTSPLTIEAQSISGIVIRFSDRRTDLSGNIQDTSGKPDTNATVLIFPADYRAWIQNGMSALAARTVPASQAGTYSATGLRPGEYLVAAASEEFLADWQQAAKIEALAPFAERVTLTRGEVKRQDLRTRPGR